MTSKGVNVQVLLRCRPPTASEKLKTAIICDESKNEVSVLHSSDRRQTVDRTFTFDKVFGSTSTQAEVYNKAITPIVNEVLDGFNCTVFAYGQTGTGKTFTMEGEHAGPNVRDLPSKAGVIPRAVKQIFDTLERQAAEYTVKVTFLELYNEELTDLLAAEEVFRVGDERKRSLALMEDGKGGVMVRGLEEETVKSAEDIFSLLDRGTAKRRTAETLLNKQSSRSHSIFTITIHMREVSSGGEEDLLKCGKLNLVDLAGSENISRSGAKDNRAREAGEINKSLLTLGRVITALVEHTGHVPYRDSKLTRLLRDSLGGKTKTCIIATISPALTGLEETINTLDYAQRAKHIKNKPEVNQKIHKSALVKDMSSEIERLRSELYATRERNGVYIPRDKYDADELERQTLASKCQEQEARLQQTEAEIATWMARFETEASLRQKTQEDLDSTRSALGSSQALLAQRVEEIRRQQATIQGLQHSEVQLLTEAKQLRGELERAAEDINGLFAKIERMAAVESHNLAASRQLRDSVKQQVAGVVEAVAAATMQMNASLEDIQHQMQEALGKRGNESASLQRELDGMEQLLSESVEDSSGAVARYETKMGAWAKEMLQGEEDQRKEMQKLLSASVSTIDSCLSSLAASTSASAAELSSIIAKQDEVLNSIAFATSKVTNETLRDIQSLRQKLRGSMAAVLRQQEEQRTEVKEVADDIELTLRADHESLVTSIMQMLQTSRQQLEEKLKSRVHRIVASSAACSTAAEQAAADMDKTFSACEANLDAVPMAVEKMRGEGGLLVVEHDKRVSEQESSCLASISSMQQQWLSSQQSLQHSAAAYGESFARRIKLQQSEAGMLLLEVRRAGEGVEKRGRVNRAAIKQLLEDAQLASAADSQWATEHLKEQQAAQGRLKASHAAEMETLTGHVNRFVSSDIENYVQTSKSPRKRPINIPSEEHLRRMCFSKSSLTPGHKMVSSPTGSKPSPFQRRIPSTPLAVVSNNLEHDA